MRIAWKPRKAPHSGSRSRFRQVAWTAALILWSFPAAAAESDYAAGAAAYRSGDFGVAVQLINPLAEAGDGNAQFLMGKMNESGFGTGVNYEEAVRWYRLAARQNIVRAQYHLGLLYETGEGVGRDFDEAAKYFLKAANAGYPPAQANLARLYLVGRGVPVDPTQAYFWSAVAAIQGYSTAAALRVKASSELSGDEVNALVKSARQWVDDNT